MNESACPSCGFPLWSPPGRVCGAALRHNWPPLNADLTPEQNHDLVMAQWLAIRHAAESSA